MMILLTVSEADQVRGPTAPNHALAPRELADGNFVLPVEVLDDPAHEQHHAFLNNLPIIADPPIQDYLILGPPGMTTRP